MTAVALDRPVLRKAQRLRGHTLVLRDAVLADAAFIHSQRLLPRNAAQLSATSTQLADQQAWMRRYAADASQAYFIIESSHGQALGTVRLYDAREDSFCWGSWMLSDQAAPTAAMESALLVYHYALDTLGFTQSHFQVNRGNLSVQRFHEQFFGAQRVAEDEAEVHYRATPAALRGALQRWRRYLPAGYTADLT